MLDVPLGWGLSPHTWQGAWGGRRGAAGGGRLEKFWVWSESGLAPHFATYRQERR